jgi:hypothetical protein
MADRLDDAAWRELLASEFHAPPLHLTVADWQDLMASSPHVCGPAVGLAGKLDAELAGLIQSYAANGIEGAQAYGVEHQLDMQDGQVPVTITAASEDVINDLREQIVGAGGVVETDFGNVLYATLPVGRLERFVRRESVWRVDRSRQVASPPGGVDTGISGPVSEK